MQHEVSDYPTWEDDKSRKIPKWLPFKNYSSELLIFDVHILGAYVEISSKYEVSMSNRAVHRRQQRHRTTHDGQSMIKYETLCQDFG